MRETLRKLGVEAVGGARVRATEPDRLLLDDGAEVPSDLTIWCGGFAAPPLARESGIAVDEQGAVLTDAVAPVDLASLGPGGRRQRPRTRA